MNRYLYRQKKWLRRASGPIGGRVLWGSWTHWRVNVEPGMADPDGVSGRGLRPRPDVTVSKSYGTDQRFVLRISSRVERTYAIRYS